MDDQQSEGQAALDLATTMRQRMSLDAVGFAEDTSLTARTR